MKSTTDGDISIGNDTPTGEPKSGPKGPYTTDKTDDETAPTRTETEITKRSEVGSDPAGGAKR